MTARPKPHIHGRDHEHGGADPTLIHWEDVGGPGTGGGGIQFDTDPQTGEFLVVTTTGHIDGSGTGDDGIEIYANHGDIGLSATGGTNEGAILIAADNGVSIQGWGDNGVIVQAKGDGDLLLQTITGTAQLTLEVSHAGGHYLRIVGLPTSNPGGANRVWNNGGVLSIT